MLDVVVHHDDLGEDEGEIRQIDVVRVVVRQLLDEALNSTGKFDSTLDLIAKLEPALYSRIGFIFRKNVPDKDIVVADRARNALAEHARRPLPPPEKEE